MVNKSVREIQDCSTTRNALAQLRNQSSDPEWKTRTLGEILQSVGMFRRAIQALRDAEGNTVIDRVNDIETDIEAAEMAVMCEQLERVCSDPAYSNVKLANFLVEALGSDTDAEDLALLELYAPKYDSVAAEYYSRFESIDERLGVIDPDLGFEKIIIANLALGQKPPRISGDYETALEKLENEGINDFLRMFHMYSQFRYLAWYIENGFRVSNYDRGPYLSWRSVDEEAVKKLEILAKFLKENDYVYDNNATKAVRFEVDGAPQLRVIKTGRWAKIEDVPVDQYDFQNR